MYIGQGRTAWDQLGKATMPRSWAPSSHRYPQYTPGYQWVPTNPQYSSCSWSAHGAQCLHPGAAPEGTCFVLDPTPALCSRDSSFVPEGPKLCARGPKLCASIWWASDFLRISWVCPARRRILQRFQYLGGGSHQSALEASPLAFCPTGPSFFQDAHSLFTITDISTKSSPCPFSNYSLMLKKGSVSFLQSEFLVPFFPFIYLAMSFLSVFPNVNKLRKQSTYIQEQEGQWTEFLFGKKLNLKSWSRWREQRPSELFKEFRFV